MADSGGDETEEKGPFSASEASAQPRESGHLCGQMGCCPSEWVIVGWMDFFSIQMSVDKMLVLDKLNRWIVCHPKSVDKMLVLDKMDDFFYGLFVILSLTCFSLRTGNHEWGTWGYNSDWKPWWM